jgi:hypothetical protein
VTTQTADPASQNAASARSRNNEGRRGFGFFLKGLAGASALPAVAIFLYAWTFEAPRALGIVGASLVIAGASFTVGSLIGFLFGIPRSVTEGDKPRGPSAGEDAGRPAPGGEEVGLARPGGGPEAGSRTSFRDNTNLEEISDWLTKILVGVGLTQIQNLPEGLQRLAEFLGKGLGDSPLKDVFVLSLAIYSALAGFFFCYLLTRLYLPAALSASRRELIQRFEEVQKASEQTREQVVEIRRSVERTEQTIDATTPTIIHNALYSKPPQGFQNAIDLAEKYLEKDPKNARVWTYHAAAYGQRYKWEKEHPPVSAEVHAQTRQKALAAARKAIELDPSERDLLRTLWEGTIEGQDDLKVFREENDPEFAQLFEASGPR